MTQEKRRTKKDLQVVHPAILAAPGMKLERAICVFRGNTKTKENESFAKLAKVAKFQMQNRRVVNLLIGKCLLIARTIHNSSTIPIQTKICGTGKFLLFYC